MASDAVILYFHNPEMYIKKLIKSKKINKMEKKININDFKNIIYNCDLEKLLFIINMISVILIQKKTRYNIHAVENNDILYKMLVVIESDVLIKFLILTNTELIIKFNN
ncbi:MAG: hypothetical protein LBV69_05370 [Bacteroidales bacterium]|jgi:hypothetical protein|nr:hypothetical protein [Bacteroidales bacterium]